MLRKIVFSKSAFYRVDSSFFFNVSVMKID